MPALQFKRKSVGETYRHTVPRHRLEFDANLSCLPKGSKTALDGDLIIEGDNLTQQGSKSGTTESSAMTAKPHPPRSAFAEIAWMTVGPLEHNQYASHDEWDRCPINGATR